MRQTLIIVAALGLIIPVVSLGAPNLASQLAGRIVLDVENHGEAWYIDPTSLQRVYLGNPTDAFRIMSSYGLGISAQDLNLIPMAQRTGQAVSNTVPFVAQAPFGDWGDPRQQDGCEEAAALMAVAWAQDKDLSPTEARDEIIAMSDWQATTFGYYQDTSIQDTADRILKSYLQFTHYEVKTPATLTDLTNALEHHQIVILPINGQVFQPFHYTPPGPARHMILVIGYDPVTNTFTVHDPGTSQGANLQVTSATLQTSWRDYASGQQVPIPALPQSMIVVSH